MPAAHRLMRLSDRMRVARRHACVTMETFPIAAHAPTGAEPRHERVPALRLHAQRHVIADGATIAIREDEKEHDRRHDDAQHEEGNEDDCEDHGSHIRESGSTSLAPTNPRPARSVPAHGSSS
jgi:hypothetical protein